MLAVVVWLVMDWRREAAWVDVIAEFGRAGGVRRGERSGEEVRGREGL
jgi:hypothetical protein